MAFGDCMASVRSHCTQGTMRITEEEVPGSGRVTEDRQCCIEPGLVNLERETSVAAKK